MKYTAIADKMPKNVNITKSVVESFGYAALEENGLTDWKIKWGKSKKNYGLCYYSKKLIVLSEFLFQRLEDKRNMVNTVLHEVAHAIAGYKTVLIRGKKKTKHHTKEWKDACILVGARPERCSSASLDDNLEDYKYTLVCPECGTTHSQSRMPKYKESCAKCQPKFYDEKYRFTIIKNW